MNMQPNIFLVGIAALAVSSLSACSSEPSPHDQKLMEERAAREAAENKQPDTLMSIAEANSDLSTLTLAVGASGVGEELNGQGPFTGFAPTNAAFEKLGKDRLAELLDAEQKEDLAQIVKFHIVRGSLTSADIEKAIADGGGTTILLTEQGGQITASRDGGNIVLTDSDGNMSRVTDETKAKNGVLFVVDTVLIPD